MSDIPEDPAIRLVDLNHGDLGLPAPGSVFDTGQAAESFAWVMRQAARMLEMRDASADGRSPVCSVEVVGSGEDTMIRELAGQLPNGVIVLSFEGQQVIRTNAPDGSPIGRGVFYLVAP